MVKFIVLTLFDEMFNGFLNTSIMKNAISDGKLDVKLINIRDFSIDKFKKTDFPPYGGGSGMVMSIEPIARALDYAISKYIVDNKYKVIYMSPRGSVLNYQIANKYALSSEEYTYILLCGHYEGIDERVIVKYNAIELSIGDYVLTGGELPAMVFIDTVTRLAKGVIKEESLLCESHTNNLLEYPQYTKPYEYEGMKVPDVLLSGHHLNIEKYRNEESLKTTMKNRPDLLKKINN